MLKILEPSDVLWADLFNRLPEERQDIFYTPAYAEIAAHYLHKNGQPFCAVLESGSGFVLYPFLQRKLQMLLDGTGIQIPGYDIHGMYGRNGLISNVNDLELQARFHTLFRAHCAEQGIVCGFDRFHPVIENQRMAAPETHLIDIGGFIVLDLQKPIDAIEKQYKHAVRKNIKKALQSGVEIFSESSVAHLDQFLSIYTHTMQRHDAASFYYVDPEFYRAIAKHLPKNYRFFYAMLNGSFISCEFVLIQGQYCHSFLGGTLKEFLNTCPNHLLKRDIIRYAHENGCRYYLLGGGETANNAVWAYKQGFAPEGNRPSFVGGIIFDQAAYTNLGENFSRRGIQFAAERFQFYDRQH